MSFTITQLKASVTPKLRGTTLNKVSSFYEKCREAGNNVISRTWPLETIRAIPIDNALHSNVFNYTAPNDLRTNKGVIDIRPYSLRSGGPGDDIHGRYPREFDIRKESDTFAIETINGIKTLRLSKRVGEHYLIAPQQNTDGATNDPGILSLTVNEFDFVSGRSSLEALLVGAAGSAYIEFTLPSSVPLSRVKKYGSLFEWLKSSAGERITNVTVRWGTDNANYWSATTTKPQNLPAFINNAWLLARLDWDNATQTGTPDAENINYVRISFTYATGPNFKICLNGLSGQLGVPYEIIYYSNLFFRDSITGEYKSTPTSDNDIINIGPEGENIFLNELMLILIQELGRKAVAQNADHFMKQLNGYGQVTGLYDQYNKSVPCQAVVRSMTYHNFN